LDWLLSVWGTYVVPHVPDAELHVFSGAATYGATGDAKAAAMAAVLDKAKAMADQGVVLRNPVGKADLVAELETARVMVYRGDANETFCMAVAEAQALGIPAVVQPFGSMAERVHHGVTGYVEADDAAFGAAAVRLLADDSHWLAMHKHTLAQGQRDWDAVAADFERFLPNAAR
jgi:glycosyltransferase involved in cell wall biosynthesis